MEFQDLLNELPDCPGPERLPINNKPGGLRYVDQEKPEFIGPDLLPSTQIEQPLQPKIMIISAAGAVGKSTLASEIAARKYAPIWDLAQASAVGGDSMNGQLISSFGFPLAGEVSKKLIDGELFLIVDALDEARVKANEAGFDAFIENIAEIAGSANCTAFILLGRTQTAETTWLMFEDAGVSASLISIQPFTRLQAEQYIEKRIMHFDKEAAKRISQHREPFEEARNLILTHLEQAIGGENSAKEEAAREFLGYAPVLETIAVLLAKEGNYQEFIQSLISGLPVNRPLAVLEHVVMYILEREQKDKISVSIRPALENVATRAGWKDWDSLYSANEQRVRLLGLILKKDVDACPDMPALVKAKYEEQLAPFLREHPFLREGREPANKVFESYLFAMAMRDYESTLSRLVEKEVASPEYRPSKLLADFYTLLGEQCDNNIVAERQIGLLYSSMLAGETDALRVRIYIESGDPDDMDEGEEDGEGEFELVYTGPESSSQEQTETRSFRIVGREGGIVFRHRLKEASIVSRGEVILGEDTDDFEIGPSVDIRCSKIKIRSKGLVVHAPRPKRHASDNVVLDAGSCESSVHRLTVRGPFFVRWPNASAYPWSDYVMETEDSPNGYEQMHELYHRFWRIALSMRSRGRGGLARLRDKVEHQRVLKNEIGRALLKKLLDDGIIELRGRFYHWDPERANDLLKVTWEDLRKKRVTPEMESYLGQFIKNNDQLFIGLS